MDFLYIEEETLYFVVVIMGVEYAINLGDSEIDLYKKWLEENNGESPVRRNSEIKITPSIVAAKWFWQKSKFAPTPAVVGSYAA